MKLNKKKGFTIVELVIVIAIIAVLAAVLIPTFVRLIRKSKINSDTQLIKHLNSALAADAVEHEHNTMTDALNAANDFGFSVDKINVKVSENEIYWDSKNDVFCYYNDGVIEYIPESVNSERALKADEQYMLWEIVDKALTDEQIANLTHSVYLASQAAADSFNNKTVHVGVDTGNYTVANLTYENTTSTAKNIVIRTNSFDTALTINAPVDTVKHYDAVGSLNIVAVANASYHENGQVKFVEISKGRIALEKGAEVSHIHINAKVENNVKQDVFEEIIISKEATVEMPDFSRDDVEIATAGTLVVALQTGTEDITTTTELDYVWLTKQGVYEQITVSESKTDAGSTWVNTSDKPAETKTAAQQIANNIGATATVGEVTYDVGVNEDRDIVLIEQGSETVAYTLETQTNGTTELKDGNGDAVDSSVATVESLVTETVEAQPDKSVVETGATLFAGGTGTQADPFLIEDFDTMQMISFYSNRAYDSRYYSYYSSQSNGAEFVASYEESYGKYNPSYANWDVYYKVKDGVNIIDCSEASRKWTGVYLIGNFDGNGVTFKNLVGASLFDGINGKGSTPAVIKNFNVDNCLIMTGSYYVGAVARYCYYDVTFKDISISGYLEANSPASFLGQGNFYDKDCNITFIRCHSSMNLVSLNAQCGGFTGNLYGSYYNANHECMVRLVDSYFDGSLAVASGSRFSYVECHTASPIKYSISYTSEELESQYSSLYSTGHTEAKDVAYLGSTKTLTKGTISLPETGDVITIAKTAGAATAKAYIIVGLNPGNFTGIYVSEEIDLSGVGDSFSTNKVKNYNVVVNDGIHNKTEIIGDTLYIYDSRYESGYGSLTFMVVQYDSLGGIVSVSTKSK